MADELAKAANLRCRLEGVVFFWHLLRGTNHRSAHKRVKTFFARGNRVRRRVDCAGGADDVGGFSCPSRATGTAINATNIKPSLLFMKLLSGNRATLRVIN